MVEEIAIIFKRKKNEKNYEEEFIPIKVVEGFYNSFDEIFVDKYGNTYHHIAEQLTEGNCFGMRKSIVELIKSNSKKTLKEIKEKVFLKAKKFTYTKKTDESFYVYVTDKETKKKRKFQDADTQDIYKMFEPSEDVDYEEQEVLEPEIVTKKEQKKNSKMPTITKTPLEIVNEIKKTIKGQDEAIVQIVTTIWTNYNYRTLTKKNMLVIGPSGVGKSAILAKLSKILDIPITTFSIPGLSQAGYAGRNTDEILIQLLYECNKDISKAENSIVILEELDKLASSEEKNSVSTTGVQNELLKMIEGDKRIISLSQYGTPNIQIDTTNITFIANGAFSELYEKEDYKKPIGFSREQEEPKTKNSSSINNEKLMKYGIKKELLGRLPIIIELNNLNEEILKEIILTSDESELNKIIEILETMGITITNLDSIITLIAKDAIQKGIGARGISTTINKIFSKIFYEVVNNQGKYTELTFGDNIINDNNDFQLSTVVKKKVRIIQK